MKIPWTLPQLNNAIDRSSCGAEGEHIEFGKSRFYFYHPPECKDEEHLIGTITLLMYGQTFTEMSCDLALPKHKEVFGELLQILAKDLVDEYHWAACGHLPPAGLLELAGLSSIDVSGGFDGFIQHKEKGKTSKPESRKPGRRPFSDYDRAYERMKIDGLRLKDAYEEWRNDSGDRFYELINPYDSFKKAMRTRKKNDN